MSGRVAPVELPVTPARDERVGELPGGELVASGFAVVRTPLLPLAELEDWAAGIEGPAALTADRSCDAALDHDRAVLRARLLELFERPELREALFLGAPEIEASLEIWTREPTTRRGRKLERSLVRYFARAAARSLPFGLFAGTSLVPIADHTRLELLARPSYERHTTLDSGFVHELVEELARDDDLRPCIRYRPNETLHRAAGRLLYVEAPRGSVGRRHRLVSLDADDHLERALAAAEGGARLAEIAAAVARHGAPQEEVHAYIGKLIDAQVLLPELALPVTGPEPLEAITTEVEALPGAAGTATVLRRVQADLAAIDAGGVGAAPSTYRRLAGALAELPAPVRTPTLFDVDLVKPAPGAVLGRNVVEELARAARLLQRLARSHGGLARFREEFARRYGSRPVPLLEALDEESGIGAGRSVSSGGSPMIAGLDFPRPRKPRERWTPRDDVLLRKLADALSRGAREIELTAQDVDAMAEDAELKPLPGAFSVVAALTAASQEALDNGRFRLLVRGVDGPSGARLFARSCRHQPKLRERVAEHLSAEEALEPDAVYAEIVHLPEGPSGNVVCRPLLREWEIPFLGRSGAPAQRRLSLADLYVRVDGDRVTLWSQALGKRIVPRLTSAHDFGRSSLALYRFLGLLAAEGTTGGTHFDWGPLAGAPFLPAVRSGRVVLSSARWRAGGDELRHIAALDGRELYAAVADWRTDRGMPRSVVVEDDDRLLPVDFGNVLSVESFAHLVRGRTETVLHEPFHEAGNLCVRGPEGAFVNEIIVPFVQTAPTVGGREPVRVRADLPRARRALPPGSEWLYAKLYAGPSAADRMLTDLIGPRVRELLDSGSADAWFFVRYGDPDHHIRLRVRGHPARLHRDILPALEEAAAAALADGLVWRFSIDTYERELERYGGPEAIDASEAIFHADSDAVLDVLRMLEPGDRGAAARWRMALAGADALLCDFGLDERSRLALLRRLRAGLGQEQAVDGRLTRQLGERFRRERSGLAPLLERNPSGGHPLTAGFDVLRRRSVRVAPHVDDLHALARKGRLSEPIESLAESHLHMHLNRIVRQAARQHELVVYDFLERLYTSRAARQRAQ